jgi:hypothetical protein
LVVDLYISGCGLMMQRGGDIPEKVVSPETSLKAKTTSLASLSTVQLVEEADVSPKSSLTISLPFNLSFSRPSLFSEGGHELTI